MAWDKKINTNLALNILAIVAATCLFIIGLVLILVHVKTVGTETKVDYTLCTDDSAPDTTCEVQVSTRKKKHCSCYIIITLSEPILGPVTVYYELPGYDQTRAGYVTSKDDEQLAGNLKLVVSPNCGNYSYQDTPDGKKAIAPCGEIADSMFNDEYTLFYNDSIVPAFHTELNGITDEDKKKFRNPPGDLQTAFKNFVKPESWILNATELDSKNVDNNAFQNERFIAWMKTDMKRKPAFRINQTGIFEDGLPAGTYKFRVIYKRSNYVTGPRISVISSMHTVVNNGQLVAGIILLLIGICGIGVIAYYKLVRKTYVPCKTEPTE